jgi:hypothetical protein
MNYQLIKDIIQHDVDSILDIGAHFGDFTKNMYSLMPMIDDVYKFMDFIGFKELVTVSGHYMDGKVIQQDILFTTK